MTALELLDDELRRYGSTSWSVGDQLRYHTYRAYIYSSNGNTGAAEREYKVVFEDSRSLDPRANADGVVAWAWTTYALWKVKAGDLDLAEAAHERASSYNDFDLYKLLTFRLYSLKQTILAKRQAGQ